MEKNNKLVVDEEVIKSYFKKMGILYNTAEEEAIIEIPDVVCIEELKDETKCIDVCKCNSEDDEDEFKPLPILLDVEQASDCKIDTIQFQKGITDMSYLAGQLTALCNAGLTSDSALEYIMGTRAMEMQERVAKMNIEKELQCAKLGAFKAEQQTI